MIQGAKNAQKKLEAILHTQERKMYIIQMWKTRCRTCAEETQARDAAMLCVGLPWVYDRLKGGTRHIAFAEPDRHLILACHSRLVEEYIGPAPLPS
jgi:hypothetical protein